jgi:DTW domain-containing protein
LYPHEDALELNEDFKSKFPGPYHLIIPDGNWHQARRVRKREELFKAVPAVKLPPGITTQYKLRKAPQPEWVSTFEAAAHALGILEGVKVRDRMLDFFRFWVKTAIFNRTKDENATLDN